MTVETTLKLFVCDYLKSSLIECNEILEKNPLGTTVDMDFIFHNSVYKKKQDVTRNNFQEFFSRTIVRNSLKKITEFSDIQEQLKKYPNTKKLFLERNIELDEIILLFVRNYVVSTNGFNFNSKKFNQLFSSFLKFIKTEIYEIHYFTPVYNLRYVTKIKHNDFGDISLNQISSEQFKIIKDDLIGKSNKVIPGFMKTSLSYVLETTVPYEKNLTSENSNAKKKFLTFLNSSLLFSSGDLKLGSLYREFTDWGRYSSSIQPFMIGESGRTQYKLKKISLEQFKKFYSDYAKLKLKNNNWQFLQVSINRFTSSISRSDPIDKIVDLNVVLECLFSSSGETSLKIKNRLATLIGNDDEEREFYWNFMTDIYKIRNDILHGRKSPSSEINPEIEKLENISRLCVNKFLNLSRNLPDSKKSQNSRQHILEQLDLGLINRKKLDKFLTLSDGSFTLN